MEFIQNFISTIANDPTARALLCLAVLGGIVYRLGFIASYIKIKILKSFTTSFRLTSSANAALSTINQYMAVNKGLLRTTTFTKSYGYRLEIDDELDFIPYTLFNLYKILNVYVFITISRRTERPTQDNRSGEIITSKITALSRDKNKLISVLNHIAKDVDDRLAAKKIFLARDENGDNIKYSADSRNVISKQYESKEYLEVLAYIQSFIDNEDLYINYGWKYRTAIILDGIPGTGKTSIAIKIAHTLKRDIHIFPASSINTLGKHLRKIGKRGIILIDDFDRIDLVRDNSELIDAASAGKNLFSDLLNTLDGGTPLPSGTIIIATTNNVALLDAALTREGRFDKIFTVNTLSQHDAEGLVKNYMPSYTEEDVNECVGKPISYATNYCIEKAKKEVLNKKLTTVSINSYSHYSINTDDSTEAISFKSARDMTITTTNKH